MFVYRFSNEAIDMGPLYLTVLRSMEKKGRLESAHISVFEDLPDEKKVLHGKSDDGYDLIFLKKDTMDKMRGRLLAEVGKIGSRNLKPLNLFTGTPDSLNSPDVDATVVPQFPLNNKVFCQLQTMLILACAYLHINCPQVVLTTQVPAGQYCDDSAHNIIYLLLNPQKHIIFFALHEMRHAWQKKNHPEMFDNYMSLDECTEKYGSEKSSVYGRQIAEFDADIFAHTLLYRMADPHEAYFSTIDPNAVLLPYIKKAVACYATPYHGKFDIDRVIDYKAIFPDIIF